jgi:hypothetical protein
MSGGPWPISAAGRFRAKGENMAKRQKPIAIDPALDDSMNPPPDITIGAVWDGTNLVYTADYVNRLYNSCLRNITGPFDFVLYTGPQAEKPGRLAQLDPAIRTIPVGLPYWWGKFVFFQEAPPGIRTDKILYLDLDQVIIGSLDELINFPSDFACMKDYPAFDCPRGKENDANGSTFLLKVGSRAIVWDKYEEAGKPVWNPNGGHGPLDLAEQEIINDPRNEIEKDLFPETWVISYKLWAQRKKIPSDCKIVVFHGRPKMHEVTDAFVSEHWV